MTIFFHLFSWAFASGNSLSIEMNRFCALLKSFPSRPTIQWRKRKNMQFLAKFVVRLAIFYNTINPWIYIFYSFEMRRIKNQIRLNHYSNWLSLFVKLFSTRHSHSPAPNSHPPTRRPHRNWIAEKHTLRVYQFIDQVRCATAIERKFSLSDLIDCNLSLATREGERVEEKVKERVRDGAK